MSSNPNKVQKKLCPQESMKYWLSMNIDLHKIIWFHIIHCAQKMCSL